MRPLISLCVYILTIFVGGALLAPWIYKLCQTVPLLQHLANKPFSDFVNRSLLVLALAGIWPLLRALGATSAREVGLVRLSGHSRRLFLGFLFGFLSLAIALGIILAFQGRELNTSAPAAKYFKHLFRAALSGTVVSLLEEVLFRGGVFGALRRAFSWRTALLWSSGIYAILHFFRSADWTGSITWHSGLEMLPLMAAGFVDLQLLFPSFLNLILVGVILALGYQYTGNLWFSIGLHGGWVFWLKLYGFLTDKIPGANEQLWGTARLIDGWMVFFVLAITLWLTHLALKDETPPRPCPSD